MAEDMSKQLADWTKTLVEELPELALEAARAGMDEALRVLHGKLREYPPPPVGSRYKRTEELGRKFTYQTSVEAQKNGTSILGEIGTNLVYAPWVVGPDYPGTDIDGETVYQADVHRDRWWQLDEVVDAYLPEADEIMRERFDHDFKLSVRRLL